MGTGIVLRNGFRLGFKHNQFLTLRSQFGTPVLAKLLVTHV